MVRMVGDLLYRRGTRLAVRGEDDDIWFAVAKQHVYLDTDEFNIQWLEKVNEDADPSECKFDTSLFNHVDKIPLNSVVSPVKFLPCPDADRGVVRLPDKEKLKVDKLVTKLKTGNRLEVNVGSSKTLVVGDVTKPTKVKKAKRSKKLAKHGAVNYVHDDKECARKKAAAKKRKAAGGKAEILSSGRKRKLGEGAGSRKPKGKKEPKLKKPKVDKSNPNWRLKPRPELKFYEKDPMYETNEPIGFISSLSHSRLLIRSVLLKDTSTLKKFVKDEKQICSLNVPRSFSNKMTALRYAVKHEDMVAIKILLSKDNLKVNRCSPPVCSLETTGTGTYNYRSLGVKYIRALNPSRGAREGNNALTKDSSFGSYRGVEQTHLEKDMMKWNSSIRFVDSMLKEMKNNVTKDEFINNVGTAVRYGNRELAAHFIKMDMKDGNPNFTKFFLESLTGKGDPWDGQVRDASVRKKTYDNDQITPLHCACINPNTGPLEALFNACPDVHLADRMMRKPVHYAAACTSTAPLEFLLKKGANLSDKDKNGHTVLSVACTVGRSVTTRFIIKELKKINQDETYVKKFGPGGINLPNGDSWTPVHTATANGHLEVLKVLVEEGADIEKQLNTRYEKITPLMIAAANGDLAAVKYLIEKRAKIEKKDRLKRTALIHATINGAANVVSYLLACGADPNITDSSMNSCLHYACAYGWWFCLRLLLDAGADPNASNEWKLTPLGVAVLKGHKGIADHLLTIPGVDIDVCDDKGRSILLNLVSKSYSALSKEKVEEIFNLVEVNKADPGKTDHNGNSMVHFIAKHMCDNAYTEEAKNKSIVNQTSLKVKLLDYFVDKKKLSLFDGNTQNQLPVQLALQAKRCMVQDQYSKGLHCDFVVVNSLLKKMAENVDKLTGHCTKKLQTSMKSLYKAFFDNLNHNFLKEYKAVLVNMNALVQMMLSRKVFSNFKFMDDPVHINKDETVLGVFHTMCQAYRTLKLEKPVRTGGGFFFSSPDTSYSEDESKKIYGDFISMIEMYVDMFSPPLEFANKNIQFSALHEFILTTDNAAAALMIMGKGADVHFMTADGQDALYLALSAKKEELVGKIITAGANVNRVREIHDNKGNVKSRDCPLIVAIHAKNVPNLKQLLDAGALVNTKSLTDTSAMIEAVKICSGNRNKNNLALVRTLLEAGANVNDLDENLMTPLHIAIDNSTDNADSSLDLEMLLLRLGADPKLCDSHGRTPLFYAFVKKDNNLLATHIDPIQVVQSLVDVMDTSDIKKADNNGRTVLHYAAFRGSTVCTLLLLQKGADIESNDHEGQTSLAMAVLAKHESCSLVLIQNRANVNISMLKKISESKEEAKNEKPLWKFLASHFDEEDSKTQPLFKGIVTNGWLGITYIVLSKLEKFGFSFAKVIEVAFELKKFQFAKTLISQQVDESKLKEKVLHGRSLIGCLTAEADFSSCQSHRDILMDLYELLLEAGVDTTTPDDLGCTPLYHASWNKSEIFMDRLLKNPEICKQINIGDSYGNTPLGAYLWNYQAYTPENGKALDLLLNCNADVNLNLPSPPISRVWDNRDPLTVNLTYFDVINHCPRYSPLVTAICHNDLLMVDHLAQYCVDPNLADHKGDLPIQHAIRTNNRVMIHKVVKMLKHDTLDQLSKVKVLTSTIVIEPSNEQSLSYDNVDIVQVLEKSLDLFTGLNNQDLDSLLRLCTKHGAVNIGNYIQKTCGRKFDKKLLNPPCIDKATVKAYDPQDDAAVMMELLEKKAEEKQVKKTTKRTQEGCTVKNGSIYKDYDILLSKVDVSHGSFGMFNFYRLQIWKEDHKDLYVLFTNWGRIETYSQGQYQNTPFSTAEDAVKEFKKIFQSKTGNDWEMRNNFENKVKKYRIVPAVHATKVIRPPVEFDLSSRVKPSLAVPLLSLLEHITSIKTIMSGYKSIDVDTSAVPFGRIKKKALLEAKEILQEIHALIKLEASRKVPDNDSSNQIYSEIVRLSNEFYHLFPSRNFSYEKASPIFTETHHEFAAHSLDMLLEFEIAEAIILGAMYNRSKVHPLDYTLGAIGTRMEVMDERSPEAQLIMQYMYRSRGAAKCQIEAVYRVERPEESNRFTATNPSDRKLLWHGTKAAHLISILNKGLNLVHFDSRMVTGKAFGDGLYFSDVFDKSRDYCDSNKVQYLLLCDVSLGSCREYKEYGISFNRGESDPKRTKNEDTLWIHGRYEPDCTKDVKTVYGYKVPLGKIVDKCHPNKRRWTNYSEYVVFNPDNIVIRYLVRLGPGGPQPTLEDFYGTKANPTGQDGILENGITENGIDDSDGNSDNDSSRSHSASDDEMDDSD